jgi:hypothetical protein
MMLHLGWYRLVRMAVRNDVWVAVSRWYGDEDGSGVELADGGNKALWLRALVGGLSLPMNGYLWVRCSDAVRCAANVLFMCASFSNVFAGCLCRTMLFSHLRH